MHAFKPALQNNAFSPYIHFPDFFTDKECAKIRALMHKQKLFRGLTESSGGLEDKKTRGSTICGLDPTHDTQWVFNKLTNPIIKGNFDMYGFDLFGFTEQIQLARYEIGDFYDWHMDIGSGVLSQRKLSVVVQLSKSEEYGGGYLEFFKHGTAPREQGTLILFPSFMQHQVTPVVAGVRFSLVAWISGNPYK